MAIVFRSTARLFEETMIGSLCTGIGGLDIAAERAFDDKVAWISEVDEDANGVLETRYPGIPNLGDLTKIDWEHVPPVDVLTAGFPCQPVSHAGNREGVEDARWLWNDIEDAIGRMERQPSCLVLENVRGLLSANGGDAFRRVVHGLARLGYMGRWGCVRASDVGAPHIRQRIFILAYTDSERQPERSEQDSESITGSGSSPLGDDAIGRGTRMEWGKYKEAIEHWESLRGPAPYRLTDGKLSAEFVEWMMGFDRGWVTDITKTRRKGLRLLGNAVVPQQAEYAIRKLA